MDNNISLNPLVDENYADLIVENTNINYIPNATQIVEIDYRHSIVNIPSSYLDKCSLGEYKYSVFSKLYTLQSTIALESSGVKTIQSNPNFGLNGNGVLVGIIDTGIDYQNDSFRNADGTTRIASIWDQTIYDPYKTPIGLFYGAEYRKDDINKALRTDYPLEIVPSVDTSGHGTSIAGVIGGSQDINDEFSGVVTQVEFIIVKLKQAKSITKKMFSVNEDIECYQETDILFALKYISEYAFVLRKPISICITLGTNQTPHAGLDIVSSYTSILSRVSGYAVNIAAGNEGNLRRHYTGVCKAADKYHEFSLVVNCNDKEFFLEIWQITPQRLSIEIISPTGERTQIINPGLNNCYKHIFLFENSVIWINNLIIESKTGAQLILIRFENAMDGFWNFRLYNLDDIDTMFNVWLPSGNIISNETFLLNSSPDTTITSPGDSHYAMTYSAYNPDNNAIYISSGRGYTILGNVKPDLTSPGVNITAPTLNNQFINISGTSVAAAFATGIVAMVLEWGIIKGNWKEINGYEIKELLIRGADRDNETQYPNNASGYGRINIYGLFDKLRI